VLVHVEEVADIAVPELECAESLGDLESQEVAALVQVVRGGGRGVGGVDVASAGLVELGDHVHLHSPGAGGGCCGEGVSRRRPGCGPAAATRHRSGAGPTTTRRA